MMQVTKIWWDGEKLMAEPIDPASVYQGPAQQEPVAWRWENNGADKWLNKFTYLDNGAPDCPEDCEALYTRPQAREWVGLTDEERIMCRSYDPEEAVAKTEAKLKEKNT